MRKQPIINSNKNQMSKIDKLLNMLPIIASNIKKDDLIRDIINLAEKLVDADHVHVRVANSCDKKLEIINYTDEENQEIEHPKFHSIRFNESIVGRVFHQRTPERITNIQEDNDFCNYLNNLKEYKTNLKKSFQKDIENINKLIKYLERIGPAIIVPLHLENKPIGVLTALKLKKNKDDKIPISFSEEDQKLLEHFGDQVAITLRNAQLFEAAIGQLNEEKTFKIGEKLKELSKEAIISTNANDARIRFVDWNEKYLVPGVFQGYKHNISESNIFVRKIAESKEEGSVAGSVAKTKEPYLCNNLETNEAFKKYKNCAIAYKKLYKKHCEYLTDICEEKANLEPPNEISCEECLEVSTKMNKEIEERYHLLKEVEGTEKFHTFLEKQIKIVKSLSQAWDEYITNHMNKWKSEIAVPILSFENQLIGVLNVHSTEEGWFTNSDVAIILSIANRVATAIMQHQQIILSQIQEIERCMTTSYNYEKVASMISKAIKKSLLLTTPRKSKIFALLYTCKSPLKPDLLIMKENFGKYFEPREEESADDEEKDLLYLPIKNEGLGFRAIKKLTEDPDKPAFIARDNLYDPVKRGSQSAEEYEIGTTACIPLISGGMVYGLLYIHIKNIHFFTKLEKQILTLFAAKAGTALSILRRYPDKKPYTYYFGEELINECINITKNESGRD